jgi:Putative metallopeptidase
MTRAVPGALGPTPPSLGRIAFLLAVFFFCLCAVSAPASAQDGAKSVLQPRIDAAAKMLMSDPAFAGLSEARRHDTIHFVVGNLLFVLLHEMGHALTTEMGLPVLGREEDAADAYASIAMLSMNNAFSDRVLTEAAKGWFYSDRRDRMEHAPVVYYDAHGLDRQRAYQIVCYMVGSNPEKFARLADETALPEERRLSCQGDFSNAEWSWRMALKDHLRTTQPQTEIPVQYGEAPAQLEVFARIMKGIQLLETVAQSVSRKYVWRAPFVIEAKTCGSVGGPTGISRRES